MGHGILELTLEALQDALYVPEDHKLVSVNYDPHSRRLQLLVASEKLPEAAEDEPTPRVTMLFTSSCHICADGSTHPEFRKITARIAEE